MSFFHILMFTIATGFITFVHKTLLEGKDNDEINPLDNALGSYLLSLQTKRNRERAHLYTSPPFYETKTGNTNP